MTKEYVNQLCEMLLKDNLTQNGKRKLVNYIEFLQQRIDKATEYIENEIKTQGLMMYYDTGKHLDKIKSILQGEEVKNGE